MTAPEVSTASSTERNFLAGPGQSRATVPTAQHVGTSVTLTSGPVRPPAGLPPPTSTLPPGPGWTSEPRMFVLPPPVTAPRTMSPQMPGASPPAPLAKMPVTRQLAFGTGSDAVCFLPGPAPQNTVFGQARDFSSPARPALPVALRSPLAATEQLPGRVVPGTPTKDGGTIEMPATVGQWISGLEVLDDPIEREAYLLDTLLHVMEMRWLPAVWIALRELPRNSLLKGGAPALLCALHAGLDDAVDELLADDNDANRLLPRRDARGWFPIHHAVDKDKARLAERMLRKCPGLQDAILGGSDGTPPLLHFACQRDRVACVKWLLEREKERPAANPLVLLPWQGRIPLHLALEHGSADLVQALLAATHVPDQLLCADPDGYLPLHLAIRWGRVGEVGVILGSAPLLPEVLLQQLQVKDRAGRDALAWASSLHTPPGIKQLIVEKQQEAGTTERRAGNTVAAAVARSVRKGL